MLLLPVTDVLAVAACDAQPDVDAPEPLAAPPPVHAVRASRPLAIASAIAVDLHRIVIPLTLRRRPVGRPPARPPALGAAAPRLGDGASTPSETDRPLRSGGVHREPIRVGTTVGLVRSGRKMVGWAALVGGVVLLLVGASWGHAGYYKSQAPLLLLLVLGGAALIGGGVLLLRKPKQDVAPVTWRPPTGPDEK